MIVGVRELRSLARAHVDTPGSSSHSFILWPRVHNDTVILPNRYYNTKVCVEDFNVNTFQKYISPCAWSDLTIVFFLFEKWKQFPHRLIKNDFNVLFRYNKLSINVTIRCTVVFSFLKFYSHFILLNWILAIVRYVYCMSSSYFFIRFIRKDLFWNSYTLAHLQIVWKSTFH